MMLKTEKKMVMEKNDNVDDVEDGEDGEKIGVVDGEDEEGG